MFHTVDKSFQFEEFASAANCFFFITSILLTFYTTGINDLNL